jgi:hypothetical protein
MKLNIPERLTLVNVLPEKGSFATLRMIEDLKTKLYPSEKETKEFGIKQEGNNISWSKKGVDQIEIDISDEQKKVLVDGLEALDKSEQATSAHFFMYERLTEKAKK